MNNKQGFLPNLLNKYSIRKFTVGTASLLIGATLVMGAGNVARADELEKITTQNSSDKSKAIDIEEITDNIDNSDLTNETSEDTVGSTNDKATAQSNNNIDNKTLSNETPSQETASKVEVPSQDNKVVISDEVSNSFSKNREKATTEETSSQEKTEISKNVSSEEATNETVDNKEGPTSETTDSKKVTTEKSTTTEDKVNENTDTDKQTSSQNKDSDKTGLKEETNDKTSTEEDASIEKSSPDTTEKPTQEVQAANSEKYEEKNLKSTSDTNKNSTLIANSNTTSSVGNSNEETSNNSPANNDITTVKATENNSPIPLNEESNTLASQKATFATTRNNKLRFKVLVAQKDSKAVKYTIPDNPKYTYLLNDLGYNATTIKENSDLRHAGISQLQNTQNDTIKLNLTSWLKASGDFTSKGKINLSFAQSDFYTQIDSITIGDGVKMQTTNNGQNWTAPINGDTVQVV
ncbi:YSIRK-type signal peptide-containing protein [Staphylococcus devriesei]|uniref:YSIRK-type signal peptide-containing protein n=1 Tax=Staphylococcus devriesei TaxID=586733 RepID=UPI002675B905|nr:YSIRK-type signal peptide-containing protein [Staphylococcus devriesei]WKU12714.1 YSIRK-type signal peptide-containing protein [Staphylococcus devriesei]